MGLIVNRREGERLVEPLSFAFPFPPRTKKNHGRVVYSKRYGGRAHLPSAAFLDLEAKCRAHWLSTVRPPRPTFPLVVRLNSAAHFYCDHSGVIGDAVGYYQALADILETLDIVDDDKQIVSWDGARIHDAITENFAPSILFTLTPVDY